MVIGEVGAGIALGPSLLGSWSNGRFPLETRPLPRMPNGPLFALPVIIGR